MTNVRRAIASAAAALLVAAATGCEDDGESPSTTAPSSSRPTPTATTSAAPSDSDLASQSATALVREYYAVRDRLRQEPTTSLAELKSVATSTELTAQQTLFDQERERGLRQTGDTRIGALTVQSVNLDNRDPDAGKVPIVQIDVCWDVSDVDILDADGTSVVSPDRPDTGWIRYTVANYDWATDPDGGWRVATSQDLQKTPCAAS